MFFISYSHHDLHTAREIHDAIAAVGLACWRDEKWLQPGDDFAEEITGAIRQCDAFILLLSQASNSSDYVFKEVAIAHYYRRPIVPVLLERVDLADSLAPYVIRLHYCDLKKQSISEFASQLATRFDRAVEASTAAPSACDRCVDFVRPKEEAPTRLPRLITNSEYHDFLHASERWRSHHGIASNMRFPDGQSDAPVTWVSWDDAVAYCDWTGGCLPIAVGRSTQEESDNTRADSSRLGEWCDAGTERHKQVRDPYTWQLIAIVERSTRQHSIGFRCTDVRSAQVTKWVPIDSGPCQLGTDVQRFIELANIYRLPLALRQPILRRQAKSYNIGSFLVSATCVTNDEFYKFTQATGKPWPCHWHTRWLNRSNRPFPARLGSRPVVNVCAENAEAYCIWARTRLPTWMEWECAASGRDGRAYPWGTKYKSTYVNSVESGRGSLAVVDEYPLGNSCEGLRQLCGNVAEWVVGPEGRFEIRGGSYRMPCEIWGLTYAFGQPDVGLCAPDVGFRVVAN